LRKKEIEENICSLERILRIMYTIFSIYTV